MLALLLALITAQPAPCADHAASISFLPGTATRMHTWYGPGNRTMKVVSGLTDCVTLPAMDDPCDLTWAQLRLDLVAWLMASNTGPTLAQAEAMADAIIAWGQQWYDPCDLWAVRVFAMGQTDLVTLPPWNNARVVWMFVGRGAK